MLNNKLNLNDLSIFALIVKHKSFTKAAQEANLSKAWISQRISKLEQDLDVKLLNRTTRSLSLTTGGQILYQHCQSMLQEVSLAENSLLTYAQTPTGKLTITCPEISGLSLFPKLISAFNQMYPAIKIKLIITDQFIDIIQNNIDFAFRTGKLSDSNLISRFIGHVPRVLVASQKYISTHTQIELPKDLEHHQCLKHSILPSWPLQQGDTQLNFYIKDPYIESNSLIFLHQMACLDQGIAYLPYYLCADSIKIGNLKIILPDWHGINNDYYLIYSKEKNNLFINNLFKEFILQSSLEKLIQ